MGLLQFKYANDTYEKLKSNELSDIDRSRAVKHILNDNYQSFNLLYYKLWKSEEEKAKLINKVLRHSQHAYSMLFNSHCKRLLTPEQIQTAINVSIESPAYAMEILRYSDNLSEKQRLDALECVLLEGRECVRLLTDTNVKSADRLYVVERLLDNEDVIRQYIREGRSYKKIKDKNDQARKLAFNVVFQNTSKNQIFEYATKGYFYDDELKIIYDNYHEYYYDKLKLTFHSYYDYCKAFDSYISLDQKERLAKKLMTKTWWHIRKKIGTDITFPQSILDKLDAYEMAERFKGAL